ncbi:hypothetical protein KHM83_16430 [Fusibacter paucivorans]|uniref:Uncharacterized protein n=1 Tax=Fusibacter paucivorans TaxID=76009 RepID=A0ABS5PTS7_9FIRM|nr:hypothetical protein [Fusibacter paucivorans]MBS7528277.1 hypothetical protein [Fusibacter paucivorans]
MISQETKYFKIAIEGESEENTLCEYNYDILKGLDNDGHVETFLEKGFGAHYYLQALASYKYTELFTSVDLSRVKLNQEERNAFISVGVLGTYGGIDMGLGNKGNGWQPMYYSNSDQALHWSSETYPDAEDVKITLAVKPQSDGSVDVVGWYQFLDDRGEEIGTETLTYNTDDMFSVKDGYAWCRFYRFVSLVPRIDGNDYTDGSYLKNVTFESSQLYNAYTKTYEPWGYASKTTAYCWLVEEDNIDLSFSRLTDKVSIEHLK